jgi:hypothetical protein
MKNVLRSLARRAAHMVGYRPGEIAASLHSLERQAHHVDRGTQLLLGFKYRELVRAGAPCRFDDIEFRNYSQNGEDGILWYVFSVIGTTTKSCIEMCAGNGQQCNTANLIINHGWTGLLFDGDEARALAGKEFFGSHPDTFIHPPTFVHAWITAENVDALITTHGYHGDIDLLSLDLDGVDYWIWDSISAVSPRVVIAEVQAIWGSERSVTVPYRPDFQAEFFKGFALYCGASLPAFVKLAQKKGYRLVGCQRYGFNAVFLRNDVGLDVFPEIAASECFHHPFAKWAYAELRPMVAQKEWVDV